MSRRRAVSLILQALLVLLAVWYSTIRPEVREIMLGMLVGR